MQVSVKIALCFLVLVGAFTSVSYGQSDLSILYSPMAIELTGDRGTTVPFAISIINQSPSATAYFRSRVSGLHERPDGVYVSRPKNDWEYDASTWVELEESEFVVPPGGFHVLRGLVRIPRQSLASGYATVVTELLPEPAPPDVAASTEYYQEFTTALEITVGRQQKRSAFISEMQVIPTASAPDLSLSYGRDGLLVVASLMNDGDVHLKAQGQLIIRDVMGRRVRTVPLGTGRGVILPDAVLDMGSVLRGLSPGEYQAEARITYGGHRPAVARASFQIDDAMAGISGVVAGRTMRVDVTPAVIDLTMPRYGYRAGTITVSNLDSSDVRFRVLVEELLHDFDGTLIPVEPETELPYSARAWASIRPDEFVLRPGQRRNVVIGFQVPDGQAGGRYARIRVEAEHNQTNLGESSQVMTDLDVEAYITIGTDHTRRLEVLDVMWQQVPGSLNLMIGTLVGNAGNIHESVAGRYTLLRFIPASEEMVEGLTIVRDERWEVVEQVPADVSITPVLPGEQRFLQAIPNTAMQLNTQYQVIVEIPQEQVGPLTYRLDVWADEAGVVHQGIMPQPSSEVYPASGEQ